MVQMQVKLSREADQIVSIYKIRKGLKTKALALNAFIVEFGVDFV